MQDFNAEGMTWKLWKIVSIGANQNAIFHPKKLTQPDNWTKRTCLSSPPMIDQLDQIEGEWSWCPRQNRTWLLEQVVSWQP